MVKSIFNNCASFTRFKRVPWVCSCIWEPEVDTGCLPHSFKDLFFWTGYIEQVHRSSSLPPSPPPCWGYRYKKPHLAFYMSAGDLNSYLYACAKNTNDWVISPVLSFIFLFMPLLFLIVLKNRDLKCKVTRLLYTSKQKLIVLSFQVW